MGDTDGASFVDVAHGHLRDRKADAEARRHQAAIALDGLVNPATHRAAADDAQLDLLHKQGAEHAGSPPGPTNPFSATGRARASNDEMTNQYRVPNGRPKRPTSLALARTTGV